MMGSEFREGKRVRPHGRTHAGPQERDRIKTQTHLLTKLASLPAEAFRGGPAKAQATTTEK